MLETESLELATQRLPILTVSGLLGPNFSVERRAQVVERSLSCESNQQKGFELAEFLMLESQE